MTLSEAEKRRRRFLKSKKEAGGDIESLQAQVFNRDFQVHFNKEGDILGYSQEKITKKKNTFIQTFKREQVEILKGKNSNLYKVVQDPNIDTVYSIELKPVESVFVRSDQSFVTIIEKDKKNDNNKINFILIKKIGSAFISNNLNIDKIKKTLT